MTSRQGYLDGQILIAMPAIGKSTRPGRVVYLCAHSSMGAMGIVLDRPAINLRFPDLLVRCGIIQEGELIALPSETNRIKVIQGGPGRIKARLRTTLR
jgi:putative transcriptional regulator